MIRLLFDENVSRFVIDGLRRHWPTIDLERVQDVGLDATPDRSILEYAAVQRRVLVTHDQNTMIGLAYERIAAGLPFPGLIVIKTRLPVGQAIEDLGLLCLSSHEDEWRGRIIHLPLR